MKKEIKQLIEISRFFGGQKDYTLAGGGNSSYKNDTHIWVKASGTSLADINEAGFTILDRKRVQLIRGKTYSNDEQLRETEVKNDLIASNINPEQTNRPSVETSFHELLEYSYVVHLHPTMTNALSCSLDSKKHCLKLFGEEAMYLSSTPGFQLFKLLQSVLPSYRKKYKQDPRIIFIQNHGVFVSANNIEEIKKTYSQITTLITKAAGGQVDFEDIPVDGKITEFMPAFRMMLSDDKAKILKIRHNTLHSHFYPNKEKFNKISRPLIPDIIVYCKGSYLYIEESKTPSKILKSFKKQLQEFVRLNGFKPKLILIKDFGLIAAEETSEAADIALDVFEDQMKISYYSNKFGGPHFLEQKEIDFIDKWEVENYRRAVLKTSDLNNIFHQKVCVITGAAQGFGNGIATSLARVGANIVIADINEDKGDEAALALSSENSKSRILFSPTDVTDYLSVKVLIIDTVANFGGIDLFISNAGILHAGSLEEMSPETFSLMTKVNYEGFFLCVKESSAVMKLQNEYNPAYHADIIQINSKSGLKGSNKNFAYAGAKFGGLGLTQSFAMELAPYKIKVNAICPGNYFEGPLWADEKNGLFVQYLKAGKVPGAKNIDDVKSFYESMVPMSRGCRVEDVVKAIKYAVEQEYETGQAIPVTGGQIMLK